MAGNVDAQWGVGDLECGCWWIWPLFFIFFLIFFIVIILMLSCRKRRDPPCDPPPADAKRTGGRTSRGFWSLRTPETV